MTPRTAIARSALGLVALMLCLTGCTTSSGTTSGSSDGRGVIGVSLPTTADAQWRRGGDALAEELTARGYRVDLQFAASDARTQDAQIRNMLTKGADAVVVAPIASADLSTALGTAETEGVPVVQFDRALPDASARAAIATDPAELGRAQAQALLDDLAAAPSAGVDGTPDPTDSPTPATEPDASTAPDASTSPASDATDATPGATAVRLAVVAGAASDAWEVERLAAALDALQPTVADGTLEIVSGATPEAADAGGDTAEEQEARAEKRVRELRAGAPGEAPTALLALGDAVTRGVVTALTTDPADDETPTPAPTPAEETIEAPAPLVIGSGADALTLRALRDGDIDATAFADPRALVSAAADAVEALLDGREVAGDAGAGGSPSILRVDDVEPLVSSGWIPASEL